MQYWNVFCVFFLPQLAFHCSSFLPHPPQKFLHLMWASIHSISHTESENEEDGSMSNINRIKIRISVEHIAACLPYIYSHSLPHFHAFSDELKSEINFFQTQFEIISGWLEGLCLKKIFINSLKNPSMSDTLTLSIVYQHYAEWKKKLWSQKRDGNARLLWKLAECVYSKKALYWWWQHVELKLVLPAKCFLHCSTIKTLLMD